MNKIGTLEAIKNIKNPERKIPASLNLTFYNETSVDDVSETLKVILGDVVNGKIEIYITNR